MTRFWKSTAGLLAACAFAGSGMAVAADAPQVASGKILVANTFRASKLTGMNVRNSQGEKVGTIDDFVVNIETGKVSYVAMSVGGILGLGDKLFAIPYSALKFDHGKDEMFFVLNVDKEKLNAAPGFDKSNWPNMADPNWATQIDDYYRRAQSTTTGTTTTTTTTTERKPR